MKNFKKLVFGLLASLLLVLSISFVFAGSRGEEQNRFVENFPKPDMVLPFSVNESDTF